jgi:predicted acetyltransferase
VSLEIDWASPDELERVLLVMCEAFEMPYAAARPIYYSDPTLDAANKRVLRLDGQIVSCLTVVDTTCHLGEVTVRMAGIAGVATAVAARRQGFAGRLLLDTLGALAQRGYALAALLPFSRDFYRRLGWETASEIWRYEAALACLPGYLNARELRPAALTDIPTLNALYEEETRGRALHCLRDTRRWQTILEHTRVSLVYAGSAGGIEGYVLHDYRPGHTLGPTGETSATVRVLEIRASSAAARRAVVSYLARQQGVEALEYGAAWRDLVDAGLLSVGTQEGERPVRVTAEPGVMVRLVDFVQTMGALSEGWRDFVGEVALTLDDPLLLPQPLTLLLSGNGSARPSLRVIGEEATLHGVSDRLRGEVRAWSRVVVGHLEGGEAVALGLLQPASARSAAVAAELFPARSPFLPATDQF